MPGNVFHLIVVARQVLALPDSCSRRRQPVPTHDRRSQGRVLVRRTHRYLRRATRRPPLGWSLRPIRYRALPFRRCSSWRFCGPPPRNFGPERIWGRSSTRSTQIASLGASMIWDWRRRPDLNRGWRFCRLSRNGYVVDSSCFLVSAKPSFYPVFGRFWTQIGPKFWRRFFLGLVPPAMSRSAAGGRSPTLTPLLRPREWWKRLAVASSEEFGCHRLPPVNSWSACH